MLELINIQKGNKTFCFNYVLQSARIVHRFRFTSLVRTDKFSRSGKNLRLYLGMPKLDDTAQGGKKSLKKVYVNKNASKK